MMKDIQEITPAMVAKTYSGRPGCMCGCKGKYFYNSLHVKESSKSVGYDVSDSINDRMVTKILRILQSNDNTKIQDGNILYADIGKTRSYVVCLADGYEVG